MKTRLEEINELLSKQRNGTFVSVTWCSDLKNSVRSAQRSAYKVEKLCSGTFMKGSQYSKRKRVIDKKTEDGDAYIDPDTGTEKMAMRESFYEAIPGYDYRLFGQGKKDSSKKYLLLYPCAHCKSRVKYYVNNKPVTKEELEEMDIMQPSYWKKSDIPLLHMTINLDNIHKINGKYIVAD